MRRRFFFGAAAVILGTAACTSLLGDFTVGGDVSPGADGSVVPSDAPNGGDGNMLVDGAAAGFTLKKPPLLSIVRGSTGSIEVDVVRNAFDADIALTIVDLPVKVTVIAPRTTTINLTKGATHASFPIAAEPNSALGQFQIKVTASSAGVPTQTETFVLQCADPPGSLDLTFGGTGVKTLASAGAEAIVVQGNGDVIVGGTDFTNARVVRYGNDGTENATFNAKMAATLPGGASHVRGLAIRALVPSNQQVVVVGNTPNPHFFVQVYNEDGSLDTTFTGGTFEVLTQGTSASAVAVDSQQRIVAVGASTATPGPMGRRFAANGAGTGIVYPAVPAAYAGATLSPRSVVVGANDDLWIAGGLLGTNNHAFVAHITPALQPDMGFGTGGIVVLGPDGSYYEGLTMARFPSGELGVGGTDGTSKATYGVVTPAGVKPFAVAGGMLQVGHGSSYDYGYKGSAMQPDGRIILAGGRGTNTKEHPFFERRYVDGGVDLFADSGTVDYISGAPSSSEWHAAAITPGGRIVLAGVDDAGWIVARYWP
jgi:uncharacterized delta-60 repeat protein